VAARRGNENRCVARNIYLLSVDRETATTCVHDGRTAVIRVTQREAPAALPLVHNRRMSEPEGHGRRVRYRVAAVLLAWLLAISCSSGIDDGVSALTALREAAERSDTRMVQLRLHGHAWKRFAPQPAQREIQASARNVLRVLQPRSDAASLHATAVAALLAGEIPQALERFQRALTVAPDSASLWNDYAAACVATAGDDASLRIDALAAVDRSLRLAPSAEAAFNRAVILDGMGLLDAAGQARDVLDPDSPWTNELRKPREQPATRTWNEQEPVLRREAAAGNRGAVTRIVAAFPQEARSFTETIYLAEWAEAERRSDQMAAERALHLAASVADALRDRRGETLAADAVAAVRRTPRSARANLAVAQLDYLAARTNYSARKIGEAQPQFGRARHGFAAAGSPLALAAQYYLASCLHDIRDERALAALQSLAARLPAGYRALRAQLEWEIATVLARAGRLHEALALQQSAAARFEALGETRNQLTMESLAAGTEMVFGRRARAWEAQAAVFRGLSESGDRGALQRAIDLAARAEGMTDQWENAHALLTIAADPKLAINPIIYASTLRWRALAGHRLGLASAKARLLGARKAAQKIPDQRVRSQALAEVAFAEATLSADESPSSALPLISAFISRSSSDDDLLLLPEALLERAMVRKALRREADAVADLREAVRVMDKRRRTMPANELRDAYFRTADRVTRELADLLARRGDAAAALGVIDAFQSEPYERAPAAVRAGATFLVYVSLPDSLLILTSENGRVRSFRTAVSQRRLRDEVGRSTQLPIGSNESHSNVARWLLGPVDALVGRASRLVIIPDHDLAGIPFAALRLPSNGKHLIEQVEITIAPSLSVASGGKPFNGTFERALVIGNPAFDTGLFASFASLPAAEREARLVAERYPAATLLTGAAATKTRLLHELSNADLLHVAAHALTVPHDPRRSHLLLAPSEGNSGVVYLSEIEQRANRLALVVLVGCRTATPAPRRRNIDNLALGFLAAGANHVAGTLWDVDDQTARRFALLLHDGIREGNRPATALRRAQLAMLRSQSPREREAVAWAAFQLYGSVEGEKEEN
jgi:CHAT domain-containing protein